MWQNTAQLPSCRAGNLWRCEQLNGLRSAMRQKCARATAIVDGDNIKNISFGLTWIIMNLMARTRRGLFNQLLLASGKVLGAAFTEKSRKHEGSVRVGI
jgi:hypothetical protein